MVVDLVVEDVRPVVGIGRECDLRILERVYFDIFVNHLPIYLDILEPDASDIS